MVKIRSQMILSFFVIISLSRACLESKVKLVIVNQRRIALRGYSGH